MTIGFRAAPTTSVPARWVPAATGAGLLLIVLAAVVERHYLQIEWHAAAALPVGWWYAAQVAGMLGGPLFFTAAGLGLGRVRPLAEVLLTRTAPNLLWYAGSVAAALVVLWRYGPVYGLTPIRDLPELLRFLLLPPAGLSLAYALALFPLLAWAVRGWPTPIVLGAGVSAAGLAAHVPSLATTGELARHLLFFLIGSRLSGTARALAAKRAPSTTRPLAAIGRAASPTAAALAPVTAVTGAILVRRLSSLDGPAQAFAAVAEPVLLAAAIVAVGLVAHRLSSALPMPVPR